MKKGITIYVFFCLVLLAVSIYGVLYLDRPGNVANFSIANRSLTETFFLLLVLAFAAEMIDSSLGMGYGTILSPVLIIMGFPPLVVVPSILLSQAFGGFSASVFHHRLKNVELNRRSRDGRIVLLITVLGVVAVVGAAILATGISKQALKTYIGILVLIMGIILLSRIHFRFSWKKMIGVGILSSFNKGMSGGGFGPVVTAGQIIAGHNHKNAIGVTTAAEAPICVCGFIAYCFLKGSDAILQDWIVFVPLTVGSLLSTPIGAMITKKFPENKIRPVMGMLVIVLGIWTLAKTWL
ncbi:MAG: sulfite exporter TauE/SafE family protein [Candidatus Euphemobacter frigidus]|nr:sulfite exporter TauE/SafE family protein [Candidatus Euphemobacter frigidus]